MAKYSFPFTIWYMTVAWLATVGSSASTAVTRMTEVPVEREFWCVCSQVALTAFPSGSGWNSAVPTTQVKGRKVALCQRGHHKGEVAAMVGLARLATKAAKRTGSLYLVGDRKSGRCLGLREKLRRVLDDFASSEGERLRDWKWYWKASRWVGITFLILWSSRGPSKKSGSRALSSFPIPSGDRMNTG